MKSSRSPRTPARSWSAGESLTAGKPNGRQAEISGDADIRRCSLLPCRQASLPTLGRLACRRLPCRQRSASPLTLPPPVLNLRHVIADLANVFAMLDEFVAQALT